ncbi:hypothetical protein [Caudoviricetes sp.]|nr:hypothetical protein [Caudoviricetes sp.]
MDRDALKGMFDAVADDRMGKKGKSGDGPKNHPVTYVRFNRDEEFQLLIDAVQKISPDARVDEEFMRGLICKTLGVSMPQKFAFIPYE